MRIDIAIEDENFLKNWAKDLSHSNSRMRTETLAVFAGIIFMGIVIGIA